MATILLRKGTVAGTPALAARELALNDDQFRLLVGSAGGNRILGVLHKIDGTTAPTVNDDAGDGYSVDSTWVDTTADKSYVCVDSTVGAAVWKETSNVAGGAGTVTSITAGTGLSGGVITTAGTVAFDPNSLTGADPAFADTLAGYDASAAAVRKFQVGYLLGLQPGVPGGRLSLATGTPVTDDLTAQSTIYYTPYLHDRITLWDGTRWVSIAFTEASIALSGLTSGKPYDVFGYLSSGVLALEILIWTNDTTRATALTKVDGRYTKNADATRLYLGTFYTTGTNTTNDSSSHRFLWNMYNRVWKQMIRQETADSWTYTTATFRSANNSTLNRLQFVQGLAFDALSCSITQLVNASNPANTCVIGVGVDSVTVNSAILYGSNVTGGFNQVSAFWTGRPGVGLHYLQWLEYSQAVGTTNWYGDAGAPTTFQFGMIGGGFF